MWEEVREGGERSIPTPKDMFDNISRHMFDNISRFKVIFTLPELRRGLYS